MRALPKKIREENPFHETFYRVKRRTGGEAGFESLIYTRDYGFASMTFDKFVELYPDREIWITEEKSIKSSRGGRP